VKVDHSNWSIDDVLTVARNKEPLTLGDQEWQNFIEKGANFLREYLEKHPNVYGVTTGYGDSCNVKVPRELVDELPLHLTRFHGCGLGRYFNEEETRAILVARLASLKRGYSGVRVVLLESLIQLLNHNILPRIPAEGSVGASGDLTPLSYVAAAVIGERDVIFEEKIMPASEALSHCNLAPITLRPKEGLAVMNGTAVMTALACIAWKKAEYLTRLTSRCTALLLEVVQGNKNHFKKELFDVKPFEGQSQIANWIYSDIGDHETKPVHQLQDRYSLRCAPHVIGVLRDALPWMKSQIETELNSTNDNPVIDADKEEILHGGHFYGGHICFVMDSMKNCVANLADLQDRQMALMTDQHANNGLPANLSGSTGERSSINHGFKAVQIGVSAWTAEALKLTMPASVFSRSTECHNQDKVSMGTIAARDCLRVIQLTQQVCAATILACVQGIDLRKQKGDLSEEQLTPTVRQFCKEIREASAFVSEDRPLDRDLRHLVDLINEEHWTLY
jgi:histidine ammonia-lyase